MALNLHESNARAKIKTVIEAVSGVGSVHDYMRWLNNMNTLKTLFVTNSQLVGWMITMDRIRQVDEGMGGVQGSGTVHVWYEFRVIGVYSVDDSAETEKTFTTLALNVVQALDQNTDLNSNTYGGGASSDFVSTPCESGDFGYRMFAGVLVHYVEIKKVIEEVV